MKRLLYLLFFISTLSFSQTIKGIITVNPKKGVGDETVLSEKAKKPIYYSYTYSNKTSIQEIISKEETTIDTVTVHHEENKELTMETTRAIIRPFKSIHFKDYNSNTYRFESAKKNRYMSTENISLKDEILTYNWTTSTDTLTVAGYLCKRATASRMMMGTKQNITAWYCDEIPINDGPSNFNGLPGLILQIEIDKNNIIKFEKLKFLKEDTVISSPKNEAPMLSINQYYLKMMNKN